MSYSTPMMKQYLKIKREHPDCILFYRLGDFYEMFGRDAEIASKILGLALTSRNKGKPEAVPLCGVPYHAGEGYIAKLIKHGHKVAICEQLGNSSAAKGVMEREVVRVITQGTLLEANLLVDKQSNFLLALNPEGHRVGLAALELSTAEFIVSEFTDKAGWVKLRNELYRLQPREILLPQFVDGDGEVNLFIRQYLSASTVPWEDWRFDYDTARAALTDLLGTLSLRGFGCQDWKLGVGAAGAALTYAKETQKGDLSHIRRLKSYRLEDFMALDPATQVNLELTQGAQGSGKQGSLLSVLDKTVTPLGGRLLYDWLLHPLLELEEVRRRHEAVGELLDKSLLRSKLRQLLGEVRDVERLISRICLRVAQARDLAALQHSLKVMPDLREALAEVESSKLQELNERWDELRDVAGLIGETLVDEPPPTLREGGLLRPGINQELDELRGLVKDGKTWVAELEGRERRRTGISSLKVRFNRVFGYYIEVSRANLALVPEDYTRKQTLATGERYYTPELKQYEEKILGAEDRAVELECALFEKLREKVAAQSERILTQSRIIAELDVLLSYAEAANLRHYVRPTITDGDAIEIIEGRHPVLEEQGEQRFIPNSVKLDSRDSRLIIITGPNMAGKSTYIRQVALIVLMSQIGSFVPAKEAAIGIVDRIFTRVGASDNLAQGESTFMVEMHETANILNNATSRSLIILDEIGRGTSTYDGLSIAWAVAEHISNRTKIGAKTLFATHYHELTDLARQVPGVKNYHVAAREWDDQLIFLYKVLEGSTDRSYGIQVARLAGLPAEVIKRAREVLGNLEKEELDIEGRAKFAHFQTIPKKTRSVRSASGRQGSKSSSKQLSLFASPEDQVIRELQDIEVNRLTPLAALNKLVELQKRLKK